MTKLLASLEKGGRYTENFALVALLAIMVLLSVLQIVNRQFLGGSLQIVWADEVIRTIVLWLAMVGSIAAARDNKHIRIDAVAHLVSSSVLRWIRVVVDLFAAGVCAMIGYHAWRLIMQEREWGDMSAIDVPVWLLHAIVPAAFILISYQFLLHVLRGVIGADTSGADHTTTSGTES